jgi:hypothetical protein
MTAEDFDYAFNRVQDFLNVQTARAEEASEEDLREATLLHYSAAGIDPGVIKAVGEFVYEFAKEATHSGFVENPVDFTHGSGLGLLIGAVAKEHAMERKVKQLTAALELIAEPEPGEEMFGVPSERRIARVALAEVADDA